MRIALVSVAPPFRGGISTHTAILYKYLCKKHTVKIFNFKRQYPNFLFPGKTQFFETNQFVDLNSLRIIDTLNPFSWYKTTSQIIKYMPDLIIFRFWNPFFGLCMGEISRSIKRKNKQIKQIALCDNIVSHESSIFDSWLTKFFFSNMDGFLVQSNKVKNELLTINKNSKFIIRNHPIYNHYGDLRNKEICRKEIGLNKDFIILYFGYVRKYKGLDTLISATKILKNRLGNFYVLAIGESYENPQKYYDLIEKNDVADVFTWENKFINDQDIAKFFSAADVVALPYHSASQSGILQIAYHFNKPVVVTNVGGLPEYVEENSTGFIVNPNDPIQLAECLSKNFLNGKFKQMPNYIIKYKEKFGWENFTNGIEELYLKL